MLTDHIVTMLQREIESIEHAILTGACPDFTSYREHVGMLTAYRVAIDIAKRADASLDEDAD